jgi:hypothetical protein
MRYSRLWAFVPRWLAPLKHDGATVTEKGDTPLPNEADSEGPDADGAGLCPICAQPAQDDRCAHHLGAFDITFAGEGQYGVGLLGGALYDVREIGEVFNAARVDYAKARIGGKSYTAAVPAWCKEDPALKKYVGSFKGTELFDPDSTDDVQEYADFLAGEGPANLLRAALSAWLKSLGIRVISTRWQQDIPMVSSDYEEWWCQSPRDAAAKLTHRLREMLKRRAKR